MEQTEKLTKICVQCKFVGEPKKFSGRFCRKCYEQNRKAGIILRPKTWVDSEIDGYKICKECNFEGPKDLFFKRECWNCYNEKCREEYYAKTGRTAPKKMPDNFCSVCKLPQEKFFDGRKCEACYKKQKSERDLKYQKDNKEKINAKNKKWKKNNPEKVKKSRRRRDKERKKSDLFYKIRHNFSSKIALMLHNYNNSKQGKSILEYVPWTKEEFIAHVVSLFSHPDNLTSDGKVWMTLDNYGKYITNGVGAWNDNDPKTWTWQIDHIIPQSDLPYDSMEHPNFQKCWELENLRPLSSKQNWLDGMSKVRHKKVA